MKVLVTGAEGFVGKNIRSVLATLNHQVVTFDRDNDPSELIRLAKDCEAVIHLAGVNRPANPEDFYSGNTDLTRHLCLALKANNNNCPVILSSSIQVANDNDYGKSKKGAEEALQNLSTTNGNKIYIFRFKNLYGKWSRPNYNSVVATWCYNVARGLENKIDNPDTTIELCYIDDVVDAIIGKLDGKEKTGYYEVKATDSIPLGELHSIILSFKQSRQTYSYPDQSTRLKKNLYATYLNYLPADSFSYFLKTNSDDRGSFTEILKSSTEGQVSVNVSKPGITKGQHWHSTKNEKFLVIAGEGVIQLRDYFSKEIIEYPVSGSELEVVDIPTGYVHNIINKGDSELITLIWASELFNSSKPDTNYQEV